MISCVEMRFIPYPPAATWDVVCRTSRQTGLAIELHVGDSTSWLMRGETVRGS